jgi:endonuclease/exonuclease/phosphatase (EEP) superfamily protein YafD
VRAGVRRRVAQVAGVVAAAAAAAVGLGALAGVLSGGDWPWVVLTYLRWPQVVVGTVATIVLAGLRWWRSALASAMVAAALIASVVGPLTALRTVDRPSGDTLRVVVFNTGAGNDDVAAIAAAVRSAEPDVAVLLESEDVAGRIDQRLDELTRLDAPAGHGTEAAPIVLARRDWPVTIEPLAEHRPATVVTVELDGRPVDIVAAHPLPPITAEWARSHDRAIAALTGGEGERQRAGGRESRAGVLPREHPYVLACDCNTTPWTPSMRRLLDIGLREPTVAATFAAPVVGVPTDHVLLSAELAAVSRGLGPFAGSDHRLIVTEITSRRTPARNAR